MGWKQWARRAIGIPQAREESKTHLLSEYRALRREEAMRVADDIALKGYKVYSQNDEDGVIDAIFAALGGGSTFLEIGVEDGRECNTHLLMLKGWRGVWIDGNTISCQKIWDEIGGKEFQGKFRVEEQFIYPSNIVEVYKRTCSFLKTEDLDFFSLDVDGNDSFILEELLKSKFRPKVCCVEYNGKFPPDVDITVKFSQDRSWNNDDYFGASLLRFDRIFSNYGYKLITCNLTGVNAFYVDIKYGSAFIDRKPADVWRPLRLDLAPLPGGHRPSLSFLRDALHADERQ